MFKKLLYGMAVVASLTACSEDFTDWLDPQANGQDGMKTASFTVNPVDAIDLANVTTDSVQIFSAELTKEEAAGAKYEVTFANEDGSQKVTCGSDEQGRVAVADLTSTIQSFYGKRPVARTLSTTVDAYVIENGQAIRKEGVINVVATPVAPIIENAYYLIGAQNGWDRQTVTDYKFNHSGLDVYEDPVFTITVAAPVDATTGERVDFWFNIVPESALAKDDAGFWPSLVGSDTANGDDRQEAGLSVKVDGQDNAFVQYAADGAKFYSIQLNMLDGKMTIKPLSFEEYIYILGEHQGWNFATAPMLQSPAFDGIYSGFCYLDGGFKFTKHGNWDDGEYNHSSFTTYSDIFSGEGTGNIICSTPGFYKLTADIASGSLTAESVMMGIIGPGQPGGWDADTDMTYNKDEQCWETTVDLAADEIKFRANDDWAINLGGTLDNLTQDGGNIRVTEAGNYTVKLYMNRDHDHKNIYATLTKN